MKHLIVAALVLLSLPGIGHAETPAEVAARLAGHPPVELDDYFVIKQQLGDGGTWDVQSELSKHAYRDAGLPADSVVSGCAFPDWYYEESAGFELARAAADAAAWQSSLKQIQTIRAQREDIHNRVKAGEAVDPAYAGAAGAFTRATQESDSRKAELARRVGEDQFERIDNGMVYSHTLWAKDLPVALNGYVRDISMRDICHTDRANTDWLKADLAAHGWPKISAYGAEADHDAWLLVQHADHDVAFQKSVLAILEALLPAKETVPQSYAYLYDRVAVAENRPQRYGTQGRCTGPGQWEPWPSEDQDNLDKRRAEVGLNSEAEYKAFFTFCTADP